MSISNTIAEFLYHMQEQHGKFGVGSIKLHKDVYDKLVIECCRIKDDTSLGIINLKILGVLILRTNDA